MSPAYFELEAVSFAVDGRQLLHDLHPVFPPRRVTALIGHNGSGKSTLLKLLARQLQASGGVIRFDGTPIGRWRHRDFARRVAFLPQQTPLAHGLLVRELVALGRYPWHGALGRFGREDHAKVAEALALTATEPLSDQLVGTLSGGERQRVWLAMLIAQDAEWLLLDEPISALDITHQIAILDLVRRLCRQRGLGVVVVLHDINMAARFCDDIVALHSGCIMDSGTPETIMDCDRLQAIYGLTMGIFRHPVDGSPICYVR